MNKFKLIENLSIRNKIIVIVLFVSFVVILTGLAFFAKWDYDRFKTEIKQNLILDAKLIGDYCIVPLTFNDNQQAIQTLARLKYIETIEEGFLFNESGILFARYPDSKTINSFKDTLQSPTALFIDDHFYIKEPIRFQGKVLGHILIKANSDTLYEKMQKIVWTMGIIILVLLVLSYLLALSIQKVIAEPIISLKKHFKKIASTQDYSSRVNRKYNDETGDLYDGFNELLNTIEKQNVELRESEAHYRFLFEQNPVQMLIYELGSLNLLAVNDAFVDHYGYDKSEISRMRLQDLYPEAEKESITELTKKIIGRAYAGEWHHIKKDGTIITIEVFSHGIQYEGRTARIAVLYDITERKKAEELTKESMLKFRTLFATNPEAIFITDSETLKIYDCNEAACIMNGYTYKELVGQSINILHTEEITKIVEKPEGRHQFEEYLQTNRSVTTESVHKRKDGSYFSIETTMCLLKLGSRTYVMGIDRDITERKQAEAALKQSESKYRYIVNTANEGIWTFDKNLVTTFANARMAEILGYENNEVLIGRQLIDFIFEEDLTDHFNQMEKRRKGIPDNFERRFRCKNGQAVWTLVSGTAIFDENNNFNGTLGLVTDITERKKSEEALRKSEQRYKLLLESITDYTYSVHIKNEKPVSTVHSYGCTKVTGYTPEEYLSIPKLWLNMVHPDDKELVEHYADPLCQGIEIPPLEHRVIHKNGSIIWVRNTYVLKHDEFGKVIGYDGLISDITERKIVEIEIQKLNAELEQRVNQRTVQLETANKELEAFSYSVSHDLRAPLRHASGYVDLLIKRCSNELSEKGLHYLNSVSDSVHQMGMLIDDLLQFSRTGRTEMRQNLTDMDELAHEIADTLNRDNPNRNIDWIVNKLPVVFCDRSMLKLVWMNLLSNAVKFTRTREKSKIEIGVNEDEKEFVFYVKDNGVGFDMQYSQKLFGVFQRLHSMEEFEGTGIGLANVRRIILRHEGRTWAEAELDKGATFYFTLLKKI